MTPQPFYYPQRGCLTVISIATRSWSTWRVWHRARAEPCVRRSRSSLRPSPRVAATRLSWTGRRSAISHRRGPIGRRGTVRAVDGEQDPGRTQGLLKEVWRLGQIDAETYQRAADLPSIRGERLLRGRQVTAGELRALFRACADDPTAAGRRDAALLAVLYGGGLRRAEVVALGLADYERTAVQAGTLVVHGKGNKDRLVYLPPGTITALDVWLRVRGSASGPLFVSINRGGRLGRRPLSDQAVLIVLRKRAAKSGVAHCSPHDLRRTAASDLFDSGVDVGVVKQILGHANVECNAPLRSPQRGGKAAGGRVASRPSDRVNPTVWSSRCALAPVSSGD